MAKNMKGTGMVYRGDEKTWSVYDMHLDGRVIFEAAIDNTDPELKIYVGRCGATFGKVWEIDKSVTDFGDLTVTKGRAKRSVHPVGGAPGQVPDGLHDHIDGATVQSYVYPRLTFLLAAIFVPVPKSVLLSTDGVINGEDDDDDTQDDDSDVDLARNIATRLRKKGLHEGERINFLETNDRDERIAGILRDWIADEETEESTNARLESFGDLNMSVINLDYLVSLFTEE